MSHRMTVTKMSLLTLQVCAHESVSAEEVEEFANTYNPTGIRSSWVVIPYETMSEYGQEQRTVCAEFPTHRHWLLYC